jgi:serine/threonine protein kinase
VTPERLQRIRELFDGALQLPLSERDQFLAQSCGADRDLLQAVQNLLAKADNSTNDIFFGLKPNRQLAATQLVEEASADSAASDSLPVLTKPRYVLRSKLGQGGFGAVYLATDEELHSRPVVVKVMHTASADPWRRRKFRSELEALARLSHPGIVAILDSGQTHDGRPCLVMEFAEGVPLRTLIRLEGMEFKTAAEILRQIGSALDYAHQKGIWHRDLKPENIMVQTLADGELRVRLIDFGIATVQGSEEPSSASTRIAGTYRYMAPEQLQGKPSAASDVYALGVIAYEMVTGRVPFNAESAVQLYALQTTSVPVKPRALRPNLPEEADRAILKALDLSEGNRPASVREFTRNLAANLTQPRDGHRGKAAEPHFGRLVAKMCNRRSQEDEFKSFLMRCKWQNARLPALCLVHGDEGECHESLVERLAYAAEVIVREKHDEDKVAVKLVKVPWQYDGPREVRLQRLVAWLFERFGSIHGLRVDDTSAEALGGLLSSSFAAYLVLQHDIRANRWDSLTKTLIQSYRSFLAQIPFPDGAPQLVVFLNVIYPRAKKSDSFRRLLGSTPFGPGFKKKRIHQDLAHVAAIEEHKKCPCLLLDELRPITRDDVMEWFSLHNILETEEQRLQAATKIFTPRGAHSAHKSMAEIETYLREIQQSFFLERGFS